MKIKKNIWFICAWALHLLSKDIGTILQALQTFQGDDLDLILYKVPDIKESLIEHALNINSHQFQEFVKKYCKE